jgi:transcriptional regulator with XRE-family HTH domain
MSKKTIFDKKMKEAAFRKTYEEVSATLEIGEEIARLRHERNLTQAELAKLAQTSRPAIARYESARYAGYSVTVLRKIAHACGAELEIRFVPRRTGRPAGVSEPKPATGKSPAQRKNAGKSSASGKIFHYFHLALWR